LVLLVRSAIEDKEDLIARPGTGAGVGDWVTPFVDDDFCIGGSALNPLAIFPHDAAGDNTSPTNRLILPPYNSGNPLFEHPTCGLLDCIASRCRSQQAAESATDPTRQEFPSRLGVAQYCRQPCAGALHFKPPFVVTRAKHLSPVRSSPLARFYTETSANCTRWLTTRMLRYSPPRIGCCLLPVHRLSHGYYGSAMLFLDLPGRPTPVAPMSPIGILACPTPAGFRANG